MSEKQPPKVSKADGLRAMRERTYDINHPARKAAKSLRKIKKVKQK